MRFITIGLICLTFYACRTPDCLDKDIEPVSNCRAEAACGKGTFGLTFGIILSGAGSGLSHTPNQALANYHDCVDRELQSQRVAAGLPDNSIRCVSEREYDRVVTNCH